MFSIRIFVVVFVVVVVFVFLFNKYLLILGEWSQVLGTVPESL